MLQELYIWLWVTRYLIGTSTLLHYQNFRPWDKFQLGSAGLNVAHRLLSFQIFCLTHV